MISTATSSAQKRHRQHRRQNSTPMTLEAIKVPGLPAAAMHRYTAHRRGQSLDQRAPQMQSNPIVRGRNSISDATTYHNVLRETQQQRMTPQSQAYTNPPSQSLSDFECQSLNQNGMERYTNMTSNENLPKNLSLAQDPYGFDIRNHSGSELRAALQAHHQQQPASKTNLLSPTDLGQSYGENFNWDTYLVENENTAPQTSGLMTTQLVYNPSTPTKQANSSYHPITPAATPYRKMPELAPYLQNLRSPTKSVGRYPQQQPTYMQRAKSLQGVTGSSFTEPKIEVPSPPHTAPVDFDSFEIVNSPVSDFESTEFEVLPPGRSASGAVSQPSSVSASFPSSPELAYMPLPGENSSQTPKVPIVPATPSKTNARKAHHMSPESPGKAKLSPKVASIDNLNLDARVQASITETGVTIEEIASFISGPDPEDGKWVCLHPGCGRRFGRKENIKSHVQTHLGDRQYKCDHCDKCFVRGHDLKRHAKIHTGDKPYECLCGNVFARHDALTRHRQRGMCIGGYKGVVRKTTKRGRPKKHRPEMEDRVEKANRTRQKAAVRSIAPSVSGSDISCDSPPTEIFESMSIRGSSPLEDISMLPSDNYCLPPQVFTYTPPTSPGYSTGDKPSPRSHRSRSMTPPTEDGSYPSSPAKQRLDDIAEEIEGLPPIPEAAGCFDNDVMIPSTTAMLSSPPTVPTLAGSSEASDMDMFINVDASANFDKGPLSGMIHPANLNSFSDFDDGEMDFFQGKSVSNSLSNDYFLNFDDEQSSDPFFH